MESVVGKAIVKLILSIFKAKNKAHFKIEVGLYICRTTFFNNVAQLKSAFLTPKLL